MWGGPSSAGGVTRLRSGRNGLGRPGRKQAPPSGIALRVADQEGRALAQPAKVDASRPLKKYPPLSRGLTSENEDANRPRPQDDQLP